MRDNPRIITAVTVGIMLPLLVLLLWPGSGRGQPRAAPTPRAFFTTDDGFTWFADEVNKVPPFNKRGKAAVRAIVSSCGGGKPFVNHLERYEAERRSRLDAYYAEGGLGPMGASGLEVKRPGEKEWVKYNDPRAAAIVHPTCANPRHVLP